jgi:serine/threonine protein kinase
MLQSQIIYQNRYQLIQQLGDNQCRQTWLASDLSQGTQVVVKLLAFSPQMEWEQLKLFEREAEVLQRLNHPRIPKYRDYFSLEKEEGDGLCWFGLVQDFIPGISLQQLITQGNKFTESQIKDIATQVLEILIYLHKLAPPIWHRDIKPSNLLLGEDNQIYLLDFGAVQNQGAVEGVTFTVVGTTGYAPLEQFWGKAVPASDLYALGATIIHLLTGISPADLPQEKLRIKFADRVSVNRAFVKWVEGMTEPDPHQRYQTALSALEDLKAGHFLKDNFQLITSPFGENVKLGKSHQELKFVLPIDDKYQVLIQLLIELVLLIILGYVFLLTTFPGMQIPLVLSNLITILCQGLWHRSGRAWKIVSIILFTPVILILFVCIFPLFSFLPVLIFFPLSTLIGKVVLSLKRISST